MNISRINIYLYLDIIIYILIACILFLSLILLTGIQKVFIYLYNLDSQHWLECMYLIIFISIVGCTGYIFTNLLEEMEQMIIKIKDDRRHLLQENMKLLKENKEIKIVFHKIIHSLEKEDKEFLIRD